ncbi:FHA domain-containing protein [Armatimonas sp.]|uniref:FHA domain-containing protein n=1 Tax=Armatimonas sp. TaxID=1872638 RepID=UPI00375273C3
MRIRLPFGLSDDDELDPQWILRQIMKAFEESRRVGVDGHIYVGHVCTLTVCLANEEDRAHIHMHLSQEELRTVVEARLKEKGYRTKGPLTFVVVEVAEAKNIIEVSVGLMVPKPAPVDPSEAKTQQAQRSSEAKTQQATRGGVKAPKATAPEQWFVIVTLPRGTEIEARLETFPFAIGRSQELGNSLVIEADSLSRQHAVIEKMGTGFTLKDKDSTNGTFVNGKRLAAGDPEPIAPENKIRFGLNVNVRLEKRTV